MKQGKSVINFVMVAIAVTLCIYFGFHVVNTLHDDYESVRAFRYVATDSVKVDGVLIRQEQVITNGEGILEMTRAEGEKVGVGQTLALVYRDSSAQDNQAELEDMEQEIALLELVRQDNGTVASAASMDEAIIRALVSLRSSVGRDHYGELETQVQAIKANVLKRGYTYGDPATAEALSSRLRELTSRRAELTATAATATRKIIADQSGTFSSHVDGYEGCLNPKDALSFTPAALKTALGSMQVPVGAVGKIITSDRWYFAVNMSGDAAARLNRGDTTTLRFDGDFGTDVDMKVEHISAPEEGLVTVVFSSNRYMSQVTLLRRQTAELLFHSWSGLRLPKNAVHMEKITTVDEDTQIESFTTRLGVYAVVGGRAEFKGVEIVTEGEDYYVVRPTGTGGKVLRAGDEVIINTVGVSDGDWLN